MDAHILNSHHIRSRRTLCAALLIALLAMLAGCGKQAATAPGEGGLPLAIQERLSLITAQTRVQFPQFSGSEIPFEPLPETEAPPPALETPALKGKGVRIQRGVQIGKPEQRPFALHLDRESRAHGYLVVGGSGEGNTQGERWPIVAYALSGNARKDFRFTYLLQGPDGGLRYLVLIGGAFSRAKEEFHGFEGTLIQPGPEGSLVNWRQAHKIDFGYEFPKTPPHQQKVEQADGLFKELGREIPATGRAREHLAGLRADVKDTRRRAATGNDPKAVEKLPKLEKELEQAEAEWPPRIQGIEEKLLRYYNLREALSGEFRDYLSSNPYTWKDLRGQRAVFDAWKVVEYHHPAIDELVVTYLGLNRDHEVVLQARRKAMDVIVGNDNWSRNPTRQAGGEAPPVPKKNTELKPK